MVTPRAVGRLAAVVLAVATLGGVAAVGGLHGSGPVDAVDGDSLGADIRAAENSHGNHVEAAPRVLADLHGNHVEVDSQVSADGTVVVESAYLLAEGFVVVHAPTGNDEPGEPIGHSDVLPAEEPILAVEVGIDDSTWSAWPDGRDVWVVLHEDDGDGEFEPGEDPALTAFGVLAGERITVRRGDGAASVVAQGIGFTTPTDGSFSASRVTLPADGYLVVRGATPPTNGTVASVVGLREGVHEDVAVELDRSFLARQRQRFDLRLELYVDDGNRRFDEGDRPIRAGGRPVGTTLFAQRPEGIPTVTTTPTVTATATPTVTPSETPTDGESTMSTGGEAATATTTDRSTDGGDPRGTDRGGDGSPTATDPPSPTATPTPAATIPPGTATGTTPPPDETTGASGPGPGVAGVVVASLIVVVLALTKWSGRRR